MPVDDSEYDSDSEEVDFRWIGAGQKKENDVISYRSCSINCQIYKVNDDVTIKGDGNETYVASIKSFENNPKKKDPQRVKVCWYFRPKDLPKRFRNVVKTLRLHDKELFTPLSDVNDNYLKDSFEDIDAETIDSKCSVQEIDVRGKISSNLKDSEYITRYGFTAKGVDLYSVKNYKAELVPAKQIGSKELEQKGRTDRTPSRKNASTAKTPSSKRKASKSIPDAESDIVLPKKNRKESISTPKTNGTSLNTVSPRTKALNTTQALGELMKDSDDDNEVFEESSDDESSLASEIKEMKIYQNNNKHEKSEGRITTDGPPREPPRELSKNLESSAPDKSRRTLRSRAPPTDILITTPATEKRISAKKKRNNIVTQSASSVRQPQSRESEDDSDDLDKNYKPDENEEHSDEHESEGSSENEDEKSSTDSDFQDETPRKSKAKTRKRINPKKSNSKTPKTPSTSMKTPIRAKTPRSVGKRVMTPSISGRSMPCATPKTPLEHARQRLHVSAVPDSLPCREQEFADIYSFVQGKLSANMGGNAVLQTKHGK